MTRRRTRRSGFPGRQLLCLLLAWGAMASAAMADNGLLWLEVNETGVYRVAFEDLQAAGLDLKGADPELLQLQNRGEPVPLRVARNGKGNPHAFGPGWYLEFVGEGIHTLYTKTNVYQLSLSETANERITVERSRAQKNDAVTRQYQHRVVLDDEVNWSYITPTGDPWTLESIYAFSPQRRTRQVPVDAIADTSAEASLTLSLWGSNAWDDEALDHHVIVEFGGDAVGEAYAEGITPFTVEASVPAGSLVEGDNPVTVFVPLDTGVPYSLVELVSIELAYPRLTRSADGQSLVFDAAGEALEVTGLASNAISVYARDAAGGVRWLENVDVFDDGAGGYTAKFIGSAETLKYFVVTDGAIRTPALTPPPADTDITTVPAEYLVIAHPDFMGLGSGGALQDLMLVRGSGGMSTNLVSIEDIYAQFSHGIVDALAIRDYIRYAHEHLGTRMVLLVGGDTVDYHNNYHWLVGGNGEPIYQAVSFVPSLYGPTGPYVQVAPIDAAYTDVDGDEIPDLPIGRLPVRTAQELSTIVEKTLAWEYRDYTYDSLLIADKLDANAGYNFTDDADLLYSLLPAAWQAGATKAYVDADGVQAARSKILQRLNEGVALTSFTGHSSATRWTFDGLFSSTDARNLTNELRPTVVTQWGCWNTFYVHPLENTLGHEFLLNGAQGAAAVLGAATLTQAGHERELARLMFAELFEPGQTLGEAILAAKRRYLETKDFDRDVILGWSLLGDPALQIGM